MTFLPHLNNVDSFENQIDLEIEMAQKHRAKDFHPKTTEEGKKKYQEKEKMKYKKLVEQFNTLMDQSPNVDSKISGRILEKLTNLFQDGANRRGLIKILPWLFKIDPVAAENMVDTDPLAQAQARIFPVSQEIHFPDPENQDLQRFSSLYDRIKQASLERRFEQSLDAWVAEARPNENRQEVATRIRAVYNGGQPDGSTYLDLTGLGLTNIPEVVGALRNLKRISIDNNAILEKPEAFQHAQRNVVLALIKENRSFFEHVRSDLKEDRQFILDALKQNAAVLQLLPPIIRYDITFLEKVSEQGIGILSYVSDDGIMRSLVDAFSFGKEKWEKHFGDIGEVPPLPGDIVNILCGDDPYDNHEPRKKVAENYTLFFLPEEVNGEPLDLNNITGLAKNPLSGNGVEDIFIWEQITIEHGAKSTEGGGKWVMMRKDVIPGSRNELYSVQQDQVNSQPGYSVPDILSATVGILVHYVRTGECLFSMDPSTYTRCMETAGEYQTIVGGFAPAGLDLSYSYYDNEIVGVAALRKFFFRS